MMSQTKVERYLEEQKISYQPLDFSHVVEESFTEELQKRGIDPALICKTLVVKGNKTGGDHRIDSFERSLRLQKNETSDERS